MVHITNFNSVQGTLNFILLFRLKLQKVSLISFFVELLANVKKKKKKEKESKEERGKEGRKKRKFLLFYFFPHTKTLNQTPSVINYVMLNNSMILVDENITYTFVSQLSLYTFPTKK